MGPGLGAHPRSLPERRLSRRRAAPAGRRAEGDQGKQGGEAAQEADRQPPPADPAAPHRPRVDDREGAAGRRQGARRRRRRPPRRPSPTVKRWVYLTVPIVEGPQYTLGTITVTGNTVFSEREILRGRLRSSRGGSSTTRCSTSASSACSGATRTRATPTRPCAARSTGARRRTSPTSGSSSTKTSRTTSAASSSPGTPRPRTRCCVASSGSTRATCSAGACSTCRSARSTSSATSRSAGGRRDRAGRRDEQASRSTFAGRGEGAQRDPGRRRLQRRRRCVLHRALLDAELPRPRTGRVVVAAARRPPQPATRSRSRSRGSSTGRTRLGFSLFRGDQDYGVGAAQHEPRASACHDRARQIGYFQSVQLRLRLPEGTSNGLRRKSASRRSRARRRLTSVARRTRSRRSRRPGTGTASTTRTDRARVGRSCPSSQIAGGPLGGDTSYLKPRADRHQVPPRAGSARSSRSTGDRPDQDVGGRERARRRERQRRPALQRFWLGGETLRSARVPDARRLAAAVRRARPGRPGDRGHERSVGATRDFDLERRRGRATGSISSRWAETAIGSRCSSTRSRSNRPVEIAFFARRRERALRGHPVGLRPTTARRRGSSFGSSSRSSRFRCV